MPMATTKFGYAAGEKKLRNRGRKKDANHVGLVLVR